MPKVYIAQNQLFHNKIKWVLTIISQYNHLSYVFVDQAEQANISIGIGSSYDINIDVGFFQKLELGYTHWKQILPNGPIYKNEKGDPCILETIFYLVNCIQELNIDVADTDQWGRFKYTSSLQFHYGIIERNFVAELIDELIVRFPILSSGTGTPKFPAQVFLSHDIDLVRSGWKIEGYLALQRYDWKTLLKVLRDMVLVKPFYNNIDQLISLNQEYGMSPCFYWLPAYGKDQNGIMNADYSINELKEMSTKVSEQGFSSGIHKSSFPTSFSEEMSRFPYQVEHNRYHFLKFHTHQAWKEIEAAGLKTDASLGFAEHIGFRNSYGLPFVPFDMENDCPFSFVAIPLHVMDVSLTKYMQLNTFGASQRLEAFFNQNDRNCLISILWHNDHFTPYAYQNESSLYEGILKRFAIDNAQKMNVDEIYDMYKF